MGIYTKLGVYSRKSYILCRHNSRVNDSLYIQDRYHLGYNTYKKRYKIIELMRSPKSREISCGKISTKICKKNVTNTSLSQ